VSPTLGLVGVLVGHKVKVYLGAVLGDLVGAADGVAVVGTALGPGVRRLVVGPSVGGALLGVALGAPVRAAAVGLALGADVGDVVGLAVGDLVGDVVGKQWEFVTRFRRVWLYCEKSVNSDVKALVDFQFGSSIIWFAHASFQNA